MSIFDKEVDGPLDEMFDMENDGRLSLVEQAMEIMFVEDLISDDEE